MEIFVSEKARMAAIFVDEVKDLPAQLLNFQLDRRDVTHDMRLVLVRHRLEAYALLAKQCSISILLVFLIGRASRQRLEPSLTLLKFSPSNALASLAKSPSRVESLR